MINLYILFILLSTILFSQELNIELHNQKVFLKTNGFEKNILIKNDTTILFPSGVYNFFNDSIDLTIYSDGTKDYNLLFSNKYNNALFDGLDNVDSEFLNKFFSHYNLLINEDISSSFSPDQYEIFMYDVKSSLKLFLKNTNNNLDINLISFLSNYIEYIYHNKLCEYVINLTDSKPSFSYNFIPYFLDESFYFNSVNKNFNFLLFKEYIYNMTKLLSHKVLSVESQSLELFFYSFFEFAKKNLNSELLDFCLTRFLVDYSTHIEQPLFDEIFSLLKDSNSEKINNYIKNQYRRNNNNINEIKNIVIVNNHDFYLENESGQRVSLDDYSGKVLYIDIWASWCGPCRKQFPFSEELKKKFKKRELKKIVFLYISIDNDYDKWQKAIKQLEIKGENLISPADRNNGVGQYFQITSIPRYIIIDNAGNIVQKNAKRPSDETILDDLLELIN